jgi:Cys-tRNA(Pro)/Cys-tRNA(Cys) deacylase
VTTNKPAGDSTPATARLNRDGIAFTTHSYLHDPRVESFGMEAATVLGIAPELVFKTLMAEVDDDLVVAIVPVTTTLDLKALAGALHGKRARMADPALAQRATGYVLGGISPIGQKRSHHTAVDESVELWPTVYVSGGRRGFDLGLAPADLIAVTSALVAAIAR